MILAFARQKNSVDVLFMLHLLVTVVTVRMTSSKYTILTEAEKGLQPDN